MIKTFKNKDTEKIYHCQLVLKWNNIFHIATRRLRILDQATKIEDLAKLSGNRLHKLIGDRKNQYSISVNMQYRICFIWEGNNAYEVEITKHYE